jgi:valyl-tRNA synthetase
VSCQTAIAQAEFDNVELESSFNEIRFAVGGYSVVVATTRPELLPACVALAYHPDDARYQKFNGKTATVPGFLQQVPIFADATVDMTKGTGIMMVCTFGDKEDIEKWKRHNLPLRVAITKDGRLNELAGMFAGTKIKEARKAILDALQEGGVLVSRKQIKHAVNVHERCGTEIEFLKTTQWFVNVLDHKEELLAAGRRIRWYPEHMRTRYEHWVQNVNWDWAVSRQRHYGVPFPVWYSKRAGEVGKILAARAEHLPVDPLTDVPPGYSRDEVEPEYDVMDTWATSSVTPQIAMGWHTPFAQENTPMSLRLQAHDIIRTWAFYTIVKSVYGFERVPWNDIVISGHLLDPKGEKMAKSKGNVVDPIAVMATYSTDALRWWAASSKLGEDHPWQEKDITTAKRTITKLFNAGRFSIQNLSDFDPAHAQPIELQLVDRWLLHKLNQAIRECVDAFEQYEYSRAKFVADQFFWSVYCDVYLELVKDRIYNHAARGEQGKTAAQNTLFCAMSAVLKLLAPFMPHITEEIYQSYFALHEDAHSIHVSRFPQERAEWRDEAAARGGDALVQVLGGIRKYRSEHQLGMKTPLGELTIFCSDEQRKLLEEGLADLQAATNVASITWQRSDKLSWDVKGTA